MISKRNKDNSTSCSHPVTKHEFEDNKCLVHILRETTVKYSKIRSFHGQCQLDLCRHEVRYGCLREDECFYAHSLVELKVWILQNETGRLVHDKEMSPRKPRNRLLSVENTLMVTSGEVGGGWMK